MPKRTITRFLGKCLLYALPVLVGFELLFRLGFSPIITNAQILDYKIIQVQKQGLRKVKLLAIGSSCGLYDLSSSVMVRDCTPSFYNFSTYGLQVSDMRLLLPAIVEHYKPEYVLICSTAWDFKQPLNETYGPYVSTPDFILDHFPEAFYFRTFSSVHQLFYRRLENHRPGIDEWGGSPVTIPTDRIHKEVWNKAFLFPTMATPRNYADLDTLSSWLHDQKIKLIFAEMPVNLVFDNAPEARQLTAEHIEKCRSIVTAHGAIFLNYQDAEIFPDSLFFDQTHLQAAGAEILTKKLVADLKPIINP